MQKLFEMHNNTHLTKKYHIPLYMDFNFVAIWPLPNRIVSIYIHLNMVLLETTVIFAIC